MFTHSKLKLLSILTFLALSLSPSAFAIRGDYTGDGKADLAVALVNRNAKKTTWKILDPVSKARTQVVLTAPGDALVPGDYNGDGITDPAVVYVLSDARLEWHTSVNGTESIDYFGQNGDRPIVGDFDCDGKSDRAVVRTSSGSFSWYFELSSGATVDPIKFGKTNDLVFVGHRSSATCDDLVIARAGTSIITWYSRSLSSSTTSSEDFGLITDTALPLADINGDGVEDYIVARAVGSAAQLIAHVNGSEVTFEGASTTDVPFTGNFTGEANVQVGFYSRSLTKKASKFTVKLSSGDTIYRHGTSASVLVRPDGTAVQAGEGSTSACGNVVSIDSLQGVLYKSENLHGGRGPTFLVQNASERTGKSKIAIKDANCKTISYFGLYATDFPYGARYYEGSGGSNHSSEQLLSLARQAGNTYILVEGKNKWIKVNNPMNRQGNVRK